jgi:hypothetical protein
MKHQRARKEEAKLFLPAQAQVAAPPFFFPPRVSSSEMKQTGWHFACRFELSIPDDVRGN